MKYRTLLQAVNTILGNIPEHIRPDRYALIKAMKEDRGKKRWPSLEESQKLGSDRITSELRRNWPKTNKVIVQAIIHGDW